MKEKKESPNGRSKKKQDAKTPILIGTPKGSSHR